MIEKGKCACGCGQTTGIYKQTRKEKGQVRGEHAKYVRGHNKTKPPTVYETGEVVLLCECGCGEALQPAKRAEAGQVKKGEVRRFISGHNTSRGEFEYRENIPWKKCGKCGEWKSVVDEFYAKKNSEWGNNPCRDCIKSYREENLESLRLKDKSRRWRKWGFTEEEFLSMYEDLNGRCEICLEQTDIDDIKLDHCHNKDVFRGLLCSGCNLGLGHFKDSEERLSSALRYIARSNGI